MATYWENSCSFGLRYVSWYKYLIVSLGFSHLGFWSGNLFLIAPFPDLCLLVPFDHGHANERKVPETHMKDYCYYYYHHYYHYYYASIRNFRMRESVIESLSQ